MVEESNRSCSIHGKGLARGDMIMEKTKREKRQKKKGKKTVKKRKQIPGKSKKRTIDGYVIAEMLNLLLQFPS
jgi:hypothetical protein